MPTSDANAPKLSPEELQRKISEATREVYQNEKERQDALLAEKYYEQQASQLPVGSPEYEEAKAAADRNRIIYNRANMEGMRIPIGTEGVKNPEDRRAILDARGKAFDRAHAQAQKDIKNSRDIGENGSTTARYEAAKRSFDRTPIQQEYTTALNANADAASADAKWQQARRDWENNYRQQHGGNYPDRTQVDAATAQEKAAADAADSKATAARTALQQKMTASGASEEQMDLVNKEISPRNRAAVYPQPAPPAAATAGSQAPGLLGGTKPNERATAEGQSNHLYNPTTPAPKTNAQLAAEVAKDEALMARIRKGGKTSVLPQEGVTGELTVAANIGVDDYMQLQKNQDEARKDWYENNGWRKTPTTSVEAMRMYATAKREHEAGEDGKHDVPDELQGQLLSQFRKLYAAEVARDTVGMTYEQRKAYMTQKEDDIRKQGYLEGRLGLRMDITDFTTHLQDTGEKDSKASAAISASASDSWNTSPLTVMPPTELEKHNADATLDALLTGKSSEHLPEENTHDQARDNGREAAEIALSMVVFHSRLFTHPSDSASIPASDRATFEKIDQFIKTSKLSAVEQDAVLAENFKEGWEALREAVKRDKNLTPEQRDKLLKALSPENEEDKLANFMTAVDIDRNPALAAHEALDTVDHDDHDSRASKTHQPYDPGARRTVGGAGYEYIGGHIWSDHGHYYYSADDSLDDKKVTLTPDGNGSYSHLNPDGRRTYYHPDGSQPATPFGGTTKTDPNAVKQFLGGISDASGTPGPATTQLAYYDPNGPAISPGAMPQKAKDIGIAAGRKITLT